MSDDATLLRRYAEERAEDAFAELVRRHLDLVYSVALRRTGGDRHLAADIAQGVFTALARRAASISQGVVLSGWLYTTTRHIAIDTVRGLQRRQAREIEAQALLVVNSEPDAGWEELRPLIEDVLDELPARDREAVLLRFYQGRAFAEIGAEFAITEDAARMRIERALDKLQALLAKRGVTSTSSALAVTLANQAVSAAPSGFAATVSNAAITSAAETVVPALVVLQFMSTTKMVIALAVVGVMAVGTAIYFKREADRAEELKLAESTRTREVLGRLREANARRATVAVAKPAESAPAGPPATAAEVSPAVARAAASRELATNARFNDLVLQQAKASVGNGRGRFYRELGLTADQITRFESILSEAMEESWQARAAQRMTGQGMDPETVERLNLARQRMEANLRALLGEQGLQRFLDAERSAGAEAVVGSVAGAVYFSDSPLTAQQAAQLAGILTNHSPSFREGKTVSRSNLEWEAVLTEARAVLAPRQFEALRVESLLIAQNKKIVEVVQKRQQANKSITP